MKPLEMRIIHFQRKGALCEMVGGGCMVSRGHRQQRAVKVDKAKGVLYPAAANVHDCI